MITGHVDANDLKSKKCLVTGAAGYLGSHLVSALLEKGCTVHGLDLVDDPNPRQGLQWFKGDIRDPEILAGATAGVDTIFHTAAIIELAKLAPARVAREVRSVNVDGTAALLAAARAAGVKRLVHTSTMQTVLGQDTTNADERSPYTTNEDLYSSTKAESERLVLDADGCDGLQTCAIRPGGIYGPGERKTIVGPLCEAVNKGFPILMCSDLSTKLDFTFIDNLVAGQLLAAENLAPGGAACGQVYFITDEQPICVSEFTRMIIEQMNVGGNIVYLPFGALYCISFLMEVAFKLFRRPPELTRATILLGCRDNYFSTAKARRELGYEPLVNTEEGIGRTIPDARAYVLSLRTCTGKSKSVGAMVLDGRKRTMVR